ncbi:chromosome partitioning protein ParA [Haloprofundus marisrubri]|uniref:Chromosome partitioning protein ParA n=1 Tax=Haloprofundus marisrubri TaxID=1514971 RepID=A0A0W1R4Q0_9EURY|nr:MinD/ParA family protein [Haloprofundus marisrubri]KTG08090.1 chromosome partitioning protein ParA [Haloprofundus marisrubri]
MILAVVGGKGGVGKSTVAYNLTAALDEGESGRQSVVVDADLGMADLPVKRGPDLHDVLAGRAGPLEAVRPGPVDVLACGRSLAGARAADLGSLSAALERVEREYGTVVVDCPAGMRADVGVPLALADACVVVASPKPFALADAVRSRELARELDAGLAGVVLNRVVDDAPEEAVGRALGAPAETVRADPRVGNSVGEERPVVAAAPDTEAAAAFQHIASAVRACER